MTGDDEPLGLDWFAATAVTLLEGVEEPPPDATLATGKAAKGAPRLSAAQRLCLGLRELGVETLWDLLTYYPYRYIDRSRLTTCADLVPGEDGTVTVIAQVLRVDQPPARNRGKSRVVITVGDGTGRLSLVFFNQPWRAKTLDRGMELNISGKVTQFRGVDQMTNPTIDLVGDEVGRIVPVYRQSEKARITTRDIAGLVEQALRRVTARRGFAEPVPPDVLARLGLIDRNRAFAGTHWPSEWGEKERARKRLAFDELLRVQLALAMRRRAIEREAAGVVHVAEHPLLDQFVARLPFELTDAQRSALDDIAADLARPVPMHRLLQGDVGSGKTVVAVGAALMAIQGGHQAAVMAPTEVLAEQHFAGIRPLVEAMTVSDADPGSLFGERDLRLALLTNRSTAKERAAIVEDLAAGTLDLLIGTHALLEDVVAFRSLGLVVIDEQHRFGVEQRAALRDKGADGRVPDVLVMTATPIPRTAAMTVYGDLDESRMGELPLGRTPIETSWVRDEQGQAEMWEQVRAQVAAGRQAFVVCPLIEESDKLEAASATEVHERLGATELSGLRVGLLHGRMKGAAKEEVMDAFRAGDLDVLVATTVIEVGVDVPNATVMVILSADRFGLAQLHQLRGRVGRGEHASQCFVVTDPDGALGLDDDEPGDAAQRLEGFCSTTDGFVLAELDLEIRREGTIFGAVQKGRSDLKLASLSRDRDLVIEAREVAFSLVDHDRGLAAHPLLEAELAVTVSEEDRDWLMKS